MSELIVGDRGDIEKQKSSVAEKIVYTKAEDDYINRALEKWKKLKFGVIVHWGLYSVPGIVESWQLSPADSWAREPKAFRENIESLQNDYWALEKEFNPTNFDAKKTAEMFSNAGFKYCILTSKHHDGFNMYNTKYSNFKLGGPDSVYQGADLYREFFEALEQEDIMRGVYYSKADWHCTDYWEENKRHQASRRCTYNPLKEKDKWQKYVDFVHNQIRELTHNYGKIGVLWLDAGWCGSSPEDLQMEKLANIAREKQDELLIVDRTMGGKYEDYVTPERAIPDKRNLPEKAWESCIPLGDNWGWAKNNNYKSADEIIEIAKQIFSLGGNFVLGIGPDENGNWDSEVIDTLEKIGQWAKSEGKNYGL